jgi:hypothetical protein
MIKQRLGPGIYNIDSEFKEGGSSSNIGATSRKIPFKTVAFNSE